MVAEERVNRWVFTSKPSSECLQQFRMTLLESEKLCTRQPESSFSEMFMCGSHMTIFLDISLGNYE